MDYDCVQYNSDISCIILKYVGQLDRFCAYSLSWWRCIRLHEEMLQKASVFYNVRENLRVGNANHFVLYSIRTRSHKSCGYWNTVYIVLHGKRTRIFSRHSISNLIRMELPDGKCVSTDIGYSPISLRTRNIHPFIHRSNRSIHRLQTLLTSNHKFY